MPLSKKDTQIGKQEKHRPKARMDHCALKEVLCYALCGMPGERLGELTEFPTMIRVMEGIRGNGSPTALRERGR